MKLTEYLLEIRKQKADLDKEIEKLLIEFTNKTGITVSSVVVTPIFEMGKLSAECYEVKSRASIESYL
jgi:hypothetical protein